MPPAPRSLAALAAVLSLCVGLGGCKYSEALAKREWVVIFKPGATQEQHKLVLATCSDIPHVDPEPIGNGTLVSELASNVRFRVDKASDGDLNKLALCFEKFPFVQSYDPTDTSH